MKTYSNKEISVSFDEEKCIHAGECVKGLPAVFDVKRQPWINPEGAAAREIAEVVARCPSGALTCNFEATAPVPASEVVVEVRRNGPYLVKGTIRIVDESGNQTERSGTCALCRCGASRTKPYCDGSHSEVDF